MNELLDDLEIEQEYPTNYAPIASRIKAFFIDLLLIGTLQAVFCLGILGLKEDTWEWWAMYIIISMSYFALNEGSKQQATPGKRYYNIKVCNLKGEQINLAQAIFRQFGKAVSYSISVFSLLILRASSKRQTLHDILARTIVLES